VSTVLVDPDNCNEFGSSPSREILRFTTLLPKFTTCKSQVIPSDGSANERIYNKINCLVCWVFLGKIEWGYLTPRAINQPYKRL